MQICYICELNFLRSEGHWLPGERSRTKWLATNGLQSQGSQQGRTAGLQATTDHQNQSLSAKAFKIIYRNFIPGAGTVQLFKLRKCTPPLYKEFNQLSSSHNSKINYFMLFYYRQKSFKKIFLKEGVRPECTGVPCVHCNKVDSGVAVGGMKKIITWQDL